MGNRRRMRDVASGIFAGFAGREKILPATLAKNCGWCYTTKAV
jgi:hypothetical protein